MSLFELDPAPRRIKRGQEKTLEVLELDADAFSEVEELVGVQNSDDEQDDSRGE